jgi:hypothetical protein
MEDSPVIPWRLLDIDILVEDHETGGMYFQDNVLDVSSNCKYVAIDLNIV